LLLLSVIEDLPLLLVPLRGTQVRVFGPPRAWRGGNKALIEARINASPSDFTIAVRRRNS